MVDIKDIIKIDQAPDLRIYGQYLPIVIGLSFGFSLSLSKLPCIL